MQPKKKKQKLDEAVYSSYTTDDFVKTQLDELYTGIRQTDSPTDTAQLTQHLLSLKSSKTLSLEEAFEAQKEKKSAWPLPESFVVPNGTFKFVAPERVIVVGGVGCGAQLKQCRDTDLLMVIPDQVFQPKDYLNARYIVKRTLYLMHLIVKVQKFDFVAVIKLRYIGRDVLKPVLHVKCKSGDCFNLIPTINSNVFKASLLFNNKNALRPDKMFSDPGDCLETSTPFYNNSILSDVLLPVYLDFLEIIDSCPSFQQALTTLKFWSDRKDMGLSGHVMTCILLHLHKTSLISTEMDVLTIIKQTWSFLSAKFLSCVSQGIILGDATATKGCHGFFTDSGANVLYTANPAALVELARHSKIMVEMLDSRDYNMFLSVLTDPVSSPFDLYDVAFEVKVPEVVAARYSLQYCGVSFMGFADQVRELLVKGFGDRVEQVKVCYNLTKPWSRKSSPPTPGVVVVALTVNKENWTRQVERGPSAETPESKDFKEFWGDKSNLRRFQDGSIIQSVVWEGGTAQERRGIIAQITRHVLLRHASVPKDHIGELIFESKELVGRSFYEGDGEEQAQKIIKTFAELSKVLRKCSKIPLSITSVLGVSPVLRNTDLYPQMEYQVSGRKMSHPNPSSSCPPHLKVHEMVCHFEMSGKWPEDVRGILRLKAAFYLALKEELESMHIMARVNPDFLDIARNGFVFRLRFFVPKEVKLRSANISFWVPCSSEDLKVQTEILPYVSSHLASFSIQYSAFPLTVRYLKYWVASHKLSNYIPDVFCELVVAYVFLNSRSFSVPQTATSGFLRVLSFLASFDWSLYPLLVNFNGELSNEVFERYNTFINTRRAYPDACVVCPQNESSELTRDAPTTTSLKIVKLLAEQSINKNSKQFGDIFIPETSSYNLIIHLKPSQTGFSHDTGAREHHAKGSHFPVVDYNPVQCYVRELTEAYGYLCLFLYNQHQPLDVGVVMKKQGNEEVKFTVNGSMGRVLCESGMVRDNLDAVISDFDLLGKGLVRNIEVIKLDTV